MKKVFLQILCPILVSIYPIIFLYSHNVQIVNINQLILPISLAIVIAVIVSILCLLILRDVLKASLAAVVFLIIFWNYQGLSYGLEKFINLRHWHIMPIFMFVYGHIVYVFHNIKNTITLSAINKILTITISVLIMFNIISLMPTEIQKRRALPAQSSFYSENINTEGTEYPDIVFIILDEYASLDTVQEVWGYDNSEFGEFLEEEGFFLAEESKTRFTSTINAMPTLLNLDYVDEDLTDIELLELYSNNLLFHYLNQKEYFLEFLDGYSYTYPTVQIPDFVRHVPLTDSIGDSNSYLSSFTLDQFSIMVLEKTILYPIKDSVQLGNNNLYYHGNKYFFEYLKSYVNINDKPTLLFAHIMSPHLPFVFDRNGNFLENPTNYWEYQHLDNDELKRLYLEQYIYVTKEIQSIILSLKGNSTKHPIIIIQSDHGPRKESVGVEDKKYHHKVLNAIYFPDQDFEGLYSDIAPVNILRVLLNKYFGENYEILEDI